MLPVTQIDTFYNGLTLTHRDTINVAAGGTFMKRRFEECYDLIENMTAHHNDWDTSVQRSELSSSITSSFDPKIIALKVEMAKINKNLMKVLQINQQVKAVTLSYETYGGPHSYNDCPATVIHTQNVYAAGAYNQGVVTTTEFTNYMKANDAILKNMQTNMTSLKNSNLELKNMFGQFMKMNTASSAGSGTLPSNTNTNPKEDLKGITNRSGIACKGPTIPTTSSPPKVVECEIEVTKDTVPPTNNKSNKDDQPLVVQVETQVSNSKPVVEPIKAPITVTFNLDQTLRYSVNYDADLINRIDIIDVACENYSQEILGFSVSGNPTPSTKPIVSTSSPILTPFGDSDFLLKETDDFLAIDDSFYDSEGDILLFEEFLNDYPSSPTLPPQELKFVEPKNEKSFIDELPVVELEDLPPHLEYEFLEGNDKLPTRR
nr:reverse transcriptase domain-containing protein [Tanacetum cinerariifolium]